MPETYQSGKPLRLLLLTNIPTPYRVPFLTALHHELRRRHGDVLVLFARETEPNRNWYIDWSKAVFRHEVLSGIMIRRHSAFIHFNPSVLQKVIRYKPNVMLCAGSWLFPTMWLAIAYARFVGIPCIFWSEAHAGGYRRSDRLVKFARRLVFSTFNAFACPNHRSFLWTAAQCYRPAAKRYVPLPNTVNEGVFMFAPEDEGARGRLDIAQSTVVFITVCQLVPHKGVMSLVHCIADMKAEGYQCALLVVGDGPLREAIEKAAAGCDAVKLLGSCTQTEIAELMRLADAFVLNTKFDKNPLAPIEAAFCAKPILLGTASGNLKEIVVEDINGFAIDDATLPRVLRHCVNLGRAALSTMGSHSQRIAEERFATQPTVRSLIDSLRNLIDASG